VKDEKKKKGEKDEKEKPSKYIKKSRTTSHVLYLKHNSNNCEQICSV